MSQVVYSYPSTKVNDNSKIGQFGSGNKYALAYFLRNQYDIKIFSGTKEIKLDLKPVTLRDQTFEVLYVDGEKTSITTTMGKDWQFWQAMREVYCNALDEGNASLEIVNTPNPQEEVTQFYIENKGSAVEFMANFNNYFSENKKVLFECPYGKILAKSGTTANIYRRGIRCFETNKVSSFDYDFTNVEIDENRLASYFWLVEGQIWDLIFQCTNKDVIRQVLMDSSNSNFMEGSLSDYCSINSSALSKEFKEVMEASKFAPLGMSGLLSTEEMARVILLPTKVFSSLRGSLKDKNVADEFKVGADGECSGKLNGHHYMNIS